MEELVNKTLVFDYFAGKVSPLQKKSIEHWLAQPGNQDIYYQWLHEWELTNLQLTTNWQNAFQTTRQRIGATVRVAGPFEDVPVRWWDNRRMGVWVAAASVLLILGIGNWLAGDVIRYKTIETGFGETKHCQLPDGSVVELNANSRIRFPRFGFGSESRIPLLSVGTAGRQVELIGEADFSVRHLPNHQRFVVLTPKGLAVNVLGTQFTVFSRERRTQVVLRSGKVALTLPKQSNEPALIMKPGDLVTLDAQGKLALKQTLHPENASSWKQHRFTFETTSLREIAQTLHDNYGLTVNIEGEELANRTISGAFPAQDANELIKLVADLLQINYHRDNNDVTFTN
ncbi:FecR family protein [Spirosoma gilvum]